ncbi:MAG: biotin/lipoyl-binding protein, partial [Patescibacteria group bacterium]|nr:biotin/lipoyl-binding protein [Patescibacteria group bacterium]
MKKTIIIFVILAVAGAITVYFTAGKKDQVEYITAKVERGDIKQTVSETGMVKADSEIDLNFLNNGKIAKILIKIGDKIKIDQILAELDYSGLSIKEQEAQANLEIAQANLTKLLAGAATEEISVSQANVYKTQAIYEAAVREADKIQKIIEENIKQAKKTLNDLKSGAEDDVTTYEQAVTAAQTNLDNTQSSYQRSINNQQDIVLITMEDKLTITNTALDNINTIVTDDDAKNVLSVRNQTYLDNTNNNCDKAIKSLTSANNSLTGAKQNKISGNINQAASDGLTALNQTFTALNSCYSALENSIISSDFTQTELDVFKTNISAQLTVISAAISSVQTARQNLANAMLDYEINMAEAEENLKQKQASLDNAVIVAQNALASARISGEQKITTAQNSIDTARKAWQLAKAQLAQVKAPASAHDVILEQAKIKQARA